MGVPCDRGRQVSSQEVDTLLVRVVLPLGMESLYPVVDPVLLRQGLPGLARARGPLVAGAGRPRSSSRYCTSESVLASPPSPVARAGNFPSESLCLGGTIYPPRAGITNAHPVLCASVAAAQAHYCSGPWLPPPPARGSPVIRGHGTYSVHRPRSGGRCLEPSSPRDWATWAPRAPQTGRDPRPDEKAP